VRRKAAGKPIEAAEPERRQSNVISQRSSRAWRARHRRGASPMNVRRTERPPSGRAVRRHGVVGL